MKNEMTTFLSDLRTLAERRGWDDVQELANHWRQDRAGPQLLMATRRGCDAGVFQRWVAEILPGAVVEREMLESLEPDTPGVIKADRLVIILPCGQMLEAETVDAVAKAFVSGPRSRCGIVLAGAEVIADAEELDFVERGAWRVLLSDGQSDWAKQNLLERQLFLWAGGPSAEFLRARLERDHAALREWLQASSLTDIGASCEQVLAVISLAEKHASAGHLNREADNSPADTQRLLDSRETLLELRRRLLHSRDAAVASTERELNTSLGTLEQDLLNGLNPYLQHELTARPSSSKSMEKLVAELVKRYLIAGITRWQEESSVRWAARTNEIGADTQSLLEGIDWSLVNTVAERQGRPGPYPGALVHNVVAPDNLGERMETETLGPQPLLHNGPNIKGALRQVVAGTAGALLATPLGWGPVGALIGSAAGVIGATVIEHRSQREQTLHQAEDYGRLVIVEALRRLADQVSNQVQETLRPYRTLLADALRDLEGMMDRAIDESRQAVGATTAGSDEDQHTLVELRRRLLSTSRMAADS